MTPYYEDDENVPHEIYKTNSFEDYDKYFSAEVFILQNWKHLQDVIVIKISLVSTGNAKGVNHNNPILDTRVYDVMFLDGSIR